MNYCILRTDKKASIAAAMGTERHNNRTAAEYNGERRQIVKIQTEYGAQHPKATYNQFFKERTQGQTVRKNAVKAVEILLSFTNGAIAPEQLKDWAGDCYRLLCKKYGKNNIYSMYLHLDETTPHLHALIIPMDDKGKLSAAHHFNGKEKMRQLQTEYFEAVGKKYGLERGRDKAESKARHKSLKEYRAELDEEERNNETLIANLNGYRRAFGQPSADWDKYGTHILTDFIEGHAEAHNEIAKRKRPIDRGRSR